MAVIESDEQIKKTMRYKRVFNTPDGREVFRDMVLELGVFDAIDPADKERVALRNYGVTLLYNVGLTDDTVDVVIDHIVSFPFSPHKEKEQK